MKKNKIGELITYSREIKEAIKKGIPIVALESSIISHGMPYPHSLEMAKEIEDLIRSHGARPATLAILDGKINVGLDAEALSLATPNRNNAASLVDYLKNPTTFDGLESIAEVHPSIASADIFPKMRSLTEEDLYAIAGHILLQPKVVSEKWGGGKIYY